MSFSPVRNVRIRSLKPGSVVQLRFGRTAVRSPHDTIAVAKLLRHYDEGSQSFMEFEETSPEGEISITTISHFPGAAWKEGSRYVSLVGVDESTFTIQRAAQPVETDAIGDAIKLIEKERNDVWAPDQLIALLTQIQTGSRVPTQIKALGLRLAHALVSELSGLGEKKS